MRHCTRRDFTRHLGLAALFSPFLATLGSSTAKAAPGRAKYLLIFHTPGTDTAAWTPRGSTESNIQFSAMTEPLEPLRDNLILVEKLSSFGSAAGHGSPGGLTGLNYGAPTHLSVEQFISDGLRQAGVTTQIPNLLLGGVRTEQQSTFFRQGRALSPIFSPSAAYQVIFSGVGGGGTPTDPGTPDPAIADRLRRRRSVLDLVRSELGQLSTSLGSHEREKLDVHLDSIRQLEERLSQQAGEGGGGGNPTPVDCQAPGAPSDASQDLLNSVLHVDLAIQAFACDLTRVAAVQFGHHQSTQVSLEEVGDPGDWHNALVHSDNPRQRLVQLERWLCKQFVAAAEKLKALPAPGGGGSLFDQTLMVWARDMGDSVIHDGSDMRFVFAGGAGGYLRTSANGRYIDGRGEHHQHALLNACEAMGITQYSSFGDPAARSPLAGIAAG